MAAVAQYDPFDLIEGMMKSILRPGYEAARERQEAHTTRIPVDVVEDDVSYTVWADLPGVRKEDVSVSVVGNHLSLTAEAKRESAVDQGQGRASELCRERPYGTLSRQLVFGADIDNEKATAAYRDGVLELRLPKKESAQVKRLSVH